MLDQWVSVEVPIASENFTLANSSYASFEEALAHVTQLVIPGDFVYRQNDITRLDNVRVSEVPGPGTQPLLAAVVWAGLGVGARRGTAGRRFRALIARR